MDICVGDIDHFICIVKDQYAILFTVSYNRRAKEVKEHRIQKRLSELKSCSKIAHRNYWRSSSCTLKNLEYCNISHSTNYLVANVPHYRPSLMTFPSPVFVPLNQPTTKDISIDV